MICPSPQHFYRDMLSKVLREYLKVKTRYRFNASDPTGARDSFLRTQSTWETFLL